MKTYKVLSVFAIAILAISCGEPEKSASIQEAQKIHNQLTRLSGELHENMVAKLQSLEADVEAAMVAGDSLLAMELARVEGQLDQLDVLFHDWSETVIEVPGMEHDHSGHDHAGHDHGAHDHGAPSMEGMSDEEILAIQQALMAELEALQAQYDESIEALKLNVE